MDPNTLIFVDFPSDDVEACAAFYPEVFGWEVEGRPTGVFHRIVPGGHFPLDDGTPSPIGNLHMGIYDVANAGRTPTRPASSPPPGPRRSRRPRVDPGRRRRPRTHPRRAEQQGAKVLWRHHYWAEFNGFNGAFEDPWGNTVVLWTKGGDEPVIPEGHTSE